MWEGKKQLCTECVGGNDYHHSDTMRTNRCDLKLKRNDATVEENHYASIENVATPHLYVTNSQRTDEPCPATVSPQEPLPTATAAAGCGCSHIAAQTDASHHNSEIASKGTGANCDGHDGAEDYVEMSSSGSVRDSICLGGSQNSAQ